MNMKIRSARLKGRAVSVMLRDDKQENLQKLYAKAKAISDDSYKAEIVQKEPFMKVMITFTEPSVAKNLFTYLSNIMMPT